MKEHIIIFVWEVIQGREQNVHAVYAKSRLLQDNVRQKLELPVTMTGSFYQILLYIQWCDR